MAPTTVMGGDAGMVNGPKDELDVEDEEEEQDEEALEAETVEAAEEAETAAEAGEKVVADDDGGATIDAAVEAQV